MEHGPATSRPESCVYKISCRRPDASHCITSRTPEPYLAATFAMSGRRSSMSRARSSSRGRADTTQQRGRAPSIHDPYLGPNHGGYPAAADPYSDPRLYGSGADSDRSSYPSSRDASLYGDPYSRSPASAPEFRRESSSEGSRDDAGRSVSEPLRTRPAVAPRGGPNSAILDRIRSDPSESRDISPLHPLPAGSPAARNVQIATLTLPPICHPYRYTAHLRLQK